MAGVSGMNMISGIEAIARIEAEYPQISEEIQEDEGLLHIQIGTFSRLVQAFIDNKDTQAFDGACNLFVELFQKAAPELENALNVSFLEHLNFIDGNKLRSWAYNAMPENMKEAWNEMDEYNNRIHGHH